MISLLGLDFHLYGLFIGLGMIIALEISWRLAKLRKIEAKWINQLFWWVISGGIIGARLYHVIDYWQDFYRENLMQILYIWKGGLGIWGAILGGLGGLIIYVKSQALNPKFKINYYDLLDIAAVGVPLAQAVGRLGNFFNQELYGRETNLPWGFLIEGKLYHPLFLYEGLLNLFLFGLLWKLRNRRGGIISGIYLIGYGLIRLSLEWLRMESMVWKWANLPVANIGSVVAMIVGGIIIWRSQKQLS